MTKLSKIEGFRELRPEEIQLVAGGPEGPSAGETAIGDLIGGDMIVDQGPGWAITNSSVTVVDTDDNGYYDYAEFSSGGDVYVYDWTTDTWQPKEDDEPDDEDYPEDQEVEG